MMTSLRCTPSVLLVVFYRASNLFPRLQMRPVSPFDTAAPAGRSVSLGQPMSLTTGSQAPVVAAAATAAPVLPSGLPPPPDALAGVSVPITVMRARPLGTHQHR